eukprot:4112142-Amphidinium_carterae.1
MERRADQTHEKYTRGLQLDHVRKVCSALQVPTPLQSKTLTTHGQFWGSSFATGKRQGGKHLKAATIKLQSKP